MNILGIGAPEIGIIAIAALLIFGPGKLPEVMGQAGKLVRDFRRMSAELTGEFEKTIAEAKDIGSSIQGEIGGMSNQVNSVTSSVKKDLGMKGSTTTSKAKPGVTSKSATASKSTSTTTSKAGGKSPSANAKSTTTTASPKTTTATASSKPAAPVASRDDPAADISLFEPVATERPRRSRIATPSSIGDRTPRGVIPGVPAETESRTSSLDLASEPAGSANDPLARARQRRRTAGYARQSA